MSPSQTRLYYFLAFIDRAGYSKLIARNEYFKDAASCTFQEQLGNRTTLYLSHRNSRRDRTRKFLKRKVPAKGPSSLKMPFFPFPGKRLGSQDSTIGAVSTDPEIAGFADQRYLSI